MAGSLGLARGAFPRNPPVSPTDTSTMLEILDLSWGANDEPGAVVELPPVDNSGLALELHVYARRDGSLAV